MSVTGNLKTMELAELLQWLAQGKKSGTLIIDRGSVTKKVYFDRGRIVASGSTEPSEQLGHLLVSHGFINEAELTKAIETQEETGMLLGMIMVTIGGITEEELKRLLVTQTEENLYELFTWRKAEYRFVDGESIDRGMIPLPLDTKGIILRGMNRLHEWTRIREVVSTDRAVPVAVGDFTGVGLSMAEQRILEAIDDNLTVREICLHTHASEFQVSKALFRQHLEGRVKVVVPRDPPTAKSPRLSETQESAVLSELTAEALIEVAESFLDEGAFTKSLRYLRAARSLDPDDKAIGQRAEIAESAIEQSIRIDGLEVGAVAILEHSVEELTALELSPEEGFLLTRIDGASTIESLLKISPIARLDAKLVFVKLLKEGHIRLEPSS